MNESSPPFSSPGFPISPTRTPPLYMYPNSTNGTHICADCCRVVDPVVCTGRTNPKDRGRIFIICKDKQVRYDQVLGKQTVVSQCNFFRWLTRRTSEAPSGVHSEPSTSSLSPVLLSPAPSFSSNMARLGRSQPSSKPKEKGLCPFPDGCKTTRINTKCARHFCLKHCVISGGCDAPGHTATTPASSPPMVQPAPAVPIIRAVSVQEDQEDQLAPPSILAPTSVATPAPVTSFSPPPSPHLSVIPSRHSGEPPSHSPPHVPHASSSQLPLAAAPLHVPPSLAAASAVSRRLPVDAAPRHTSHMSPVFTAAFEAQQKEVLAKRAKDEQEIASKRRQEREISFVVFHTDDSDPEYFVIQDEYPHWPKVQFTEDLVMYLRLPATGFQLYAKATQAWANVKRGHQISVTTGEHVYLRTADVTRLPHFRDILAKDPHLSLILQVGSSTSVCRRTSASIVQVSHTGTRSRRWSSDSTCCRRTLASTPGKGTQSRAVRRFLPTPGLRRRSGRWVRRRPLSRTLRLSSR